MHIWYFNHYAASSVSPKEGRSYFLAKGLQNAGVKCSIVASSFHHLQRKRLPQTEKIYTQKIDGIPCLWLKSPTYRGNGWQRIKNMVSYSFSCWKYDFVRLGYLDKPDVIIITSAHPFHIIAGIKWAKHYNAKLVFEVRDLWPLSLNLLLNMSKFHPLSITLSILERIGYSKSDLVVSVLPNAFDYMKFKGVEKGRFLYLPNGFSSEFSWKNKVTHGRELNDIRDNYEHIIMHTGSMGEPNGLEILIEAANELKDNKNIAFVLIGEGVLKEKLIANSLSNHIYFFSSISKNQIQMALSYADICYCGAKDIPELYQYGVSPNKIFDYMLARKFIILGVSSPNNPVEMASAGVCVRLLNKKSLKNLIERIVTLDRATLLEKGQNGYDYVIKNHEFDELAKRLILRLNDLSLKGKK